MNGTLAKKIRVRPEFIVCFLLVVITVLVYFPVINYEFINYDDLDYVVENHHVNKGFSLDNIRWSFFSFHVSNWHPLTWLSHMLDSHLYGLDSGKHHATNLILHLLNTLLLFFVFFRTTDRIWASAFIAAFFALHPMHVESVAWVSERKDILSTFFMLVTFLFYIDWVKSGKRFKYWFSVMFFVLGLMSKPMIVTLPFLLLLFDYWPLHRINLRTININNNYLTFYKSGFVYPSITRESFNKVQKIKLIEKITTILIEKSPFFILSGLSCIITVIAQNKGGAIASITSYPMSVRLCNAVISYSGYIRKMFYPVGLAVPYPYPDSISWSVFLISACFLCAATFLAFLFRHEKPYFIVGWLWFLGTLIPVIGIVQVGAQSMADRYTYIPYTGIFVIVFLFLDDLAIKKKSLGMIIRPGIFFVLALMFFLTGVQREKWSDSITLFENTLEKTTDNYIAHLNIGQAIIGSRSVPLEKAAWHFAESIRIKPDFALGHLNLGVYWASIGKDEKAFLSYLKAIEFKPDQYLALCNLGNMLFKYGHYSHAIFYYNKALAAKPFYGKAYNGLGAVHASRGDIDKAISFFRTAVYLMPDDTLARSNYMKMLARKQQNDNLRHK